MGRSIRPAKPFSFGRKDILSIYNEKSINFRNTCWFGRIHGCRSMANFGGVKDFCLNFPKLAWKVSGNFLCEYFLPHKSWKPIFEKMSKNWAPFFQIKQRWAPFLTPFSEFAQVSWILRTFSLILLRFSRIFYKSKLLRMRLHPRLLHHW